MKPFICLPVQYFAPGANVPLAAIITAVGEGTEVNLSVFPDYAGPVERVTCLHKDDAGEGDAYWLFPEYGREAAEEEIPEEEMPKKEGLQDVKQPAVEEIKEPEATGANKVAAEEVAKTTNAKK